MSQYERPKFHEAYEKAKKEGFPKPNSSFHPAYEKVKQYSFKKPIKLKK